MTPPPRAASTQYFTLDDDGDVLAARPTPLVEVRPQERVQRHTAELIIETFVPVQVLDAPVPQMGNQVMEVLQKIDMETPEQVIAVPRISLDPNPTALCGTSYAESGTVGGSTYDRVFLFSAAAHCRADH